MWCAFFFDSSHPHVGVPWDITRAASPRKVHGLIFRATCNILRDVLWGVFAGIRASYSALKRRSAAGTLEPPSLRSDRHRVNPNDQEEEVGGLFANCSCLTHEFPRNFHGLDYGVPSSAESSPAPEPRFLRDVLESFRPKPRMASGIRTAFRCRHLLTLRLRSDRQSLCADDHFRTYGLGNTISEAAICANSHDTRLERLLTRYTAIAKERVH